MEQEPRPLDRARQLLDRRRELEDELQGVTAELDALRAALRGDPYVRAVLALLGNDATGLVAVPTPTATPTDPPPTPLVGVASQRARIRAVMRSEPERLWRMGDVAAAIGVPPEKRIATELTALTNLRDIERVETGIYRWARTAQGKD
jgi:hypothetical protein